MSGAPTAATRLSRIAALLAVVALLLAAVVSVRDTGAVSVQAGRLASGTLEALIGQNWSVVPVGGVIPRDVDLRTEPGALVGLGGGAVELRPNTTGRRVDDSFDLTSGTALVDDQQLVTLTSNLVELSGRGLWRADAGVPARAVVYAGLVVVRDAGGRTEDIQRGQQLALVASRVQGESVPLRYSTFDEVDTRVMADALAVDQFLAATATGLESDYGTAPQAAAFYADFDTLDGTILDALAPLAFERIGSRFGPPTSVLTAAVVTESLVSGAGLKPVEAAAVVDRARRSGAEYGLVTWLWDVSPSVVRDAAARALTQRRVLVAAGQGAAIIDPPAPATPPIAAPVVAATIPPSSSPVGPTTPTVPAGPTPPPTIPPSPSPTPTPTPEPSPEPTGTVGGVVGDVEGVTGPLEDIVGDELGQVVDDTVELVDDLLGGLLPGLGSSVLAPPPNGAATPGPIPTPLLPPITEVLPGSLLGP